MHGNDFAALTGICDYVSVLWHQRGADGCSILFVPILAIYKSVADIELNPAEYCGI